MTSEFGRMNGTLLASAALAAASLLVPASAAHSYVPPCVTRIISYCLFNWQQDFESYAECQEVLTLEQCGPPPYEIPGQGSPTANRLD